MPTRPALHEMTSRGAEPNIVEAQGSPPTDEIEPSSARRVTYRVLPTVVTVHALPVTLAWKTSGRAPSTLAVRVCLLAAGPSRHVVLALPPGETAMSGLVGTPPSLATKVTFV